MNAAIFRLELRRSRTFLIFLGAISVLYTAVMAGFYPRILENMKVYDQILAVWPKEMLAVFGMEGTMADPGTFFNVYIFSMIWPIVAAYAAIAPATRAVAADLDSGFLDVRLATRISRVRYLWSSIAAQAAIVGVLAALTIATIVVAGPVIGRPFDAVRFSIAGVEAWAFGCAIAAVATLLSVVTLSRGVAAGITVGALLLMYLLQAVVKIAPDLDAVSLVSAFRWFQPGAVVDRAVLPVDALAIFGIVAIAAWGAAVWSFARRDLST